MLHAGSPIDIRSLPHVLPDLPLQRWFTVLRRGRDNPSLLFHNPALAYGSRDGELTPGGIDLTQGFEGGLQQTPSNCQMDASGLDLRFRYGSRDLYHAVRDLSGCATRTLWAQSHEKSSSQVIDLSPRET